jgi:hypothetical protein
MRSIIQRVSVACWLLLIEAFLRQTICRHLLVPFLQADQRIIIHHANDTQRASGGCGGARVVVPVVAPEVAMVMADGDGDGDWWRLVRRCQSWCR